MLRNIQLSRSEEKNPEALQLQNIQGNSLFLHDKSLQIFFQKTQARITLRELQLGTKSFPATARE